MKYLFLLFSSLYLYGHYLKFSVVYGIYFKSRVSFHTTIYLNIVDEFEVIYIEKKWTKL
jgi:hypothetical protein